MLSHALLSRRDLLKFAGFGAVAVAATGSRMMASEPTAKESSRPAGTNSPLYRFRIGDFEAVSFSDGLYEMPNPQPLWAPQASAGEFNQNLDDHCLPPGKVRLDFNVLLVRTGRENILIDAGSGGAPKAPFGLAGCLAQVGLKPDDITTVFLSHAHGDHMGGMLDDSGKSVFGKARHFASADEMAFWMGANPDMSMNRLGEKQQKAFVANARRTFESIKFTPIRNDTALPDGLSVVAAPGHTPGHLNFRFSSAGEILHHIVDCAHHFAIMMPHPDWSVGFDRDEAQAVDTRKKIFSSCAAEKTRVFGYHMPFPGVGKLAVVGSGYRWMPEPWEPNASKG